jgi:perosamine synthetase
MINLHSTTITQQGIDNVIETLKTTQVSAGKKAQEFENLLSSKYGFPNSITVNSGTATMRLSLIASGVRAGDEVILPAQTFIATGHVILQCGAIPVFADINSYDGNISVESIKEKISDKTKAIIPVHWAGYPCDLDEINQIAKERSISVIEDAAHAFGSKYKGEWVGNISDFTSFSFQAIKHLTTGDGGLIACKNLESAKLIKRLRWFDIDRENSEPSILGEREYDATNIGFKYHMNDLAASLGIGNLKSIDSKLSKIISVAKRYQNELKEISGLKLMNYKEDRESSYWLFPLIVEKRIDFIKKLKDKNIPTSVVHLGIDKNTVFGGKRFDLVNQRHFDDNQIHIPIHSDLTDDDVDLIVNTIKSGW